MKDLMRLAYQVKMVCDNTPGKELDKLEEVAEAIHDALMPFVVVDDITKGFQMFDVEDAEAMKELLVSNAEEGMKDAILSGEVKLIVAMSRALGDIYYPKKKKG